MRRRGAYHRLTSIVRWGGSTRGLRGCARHRLLEPDLGRRARGRRTSGGKRPAAMNRPRRMRDAVHGRHRDADAPRPPGHGHAGDAAGRGARGRRRRSSIRDEVARGRMVIPANVHHAQPRSHGHRDQRALQDQREHRQLRGALQRGAGAGEAPLRGALRRRHGHGPVHRRGHRRDPQRDPRRVPGAHRHRADLPGGPGGDPGRGPDRGRPHRHDRAPGGAGRRLHDGPLRRALRAPAARPAPHHRHRVPRRLAARAVDGPPQEAEPALRALRRHPRDRAQVRRHALARRRPAARLPGRRVRRRAVRRARRPSAS